MKNGGKRFRYRPASEPVPLPESGVLCVPDARRRPIMWPLTPLTHSTLTNLDLCTAFVVTWHGCERRLIRTQGKAGGGSRRGTGSTSSVKCAVYSSTWETGVGPVNGQRREEEKTSQSHNQRWNRKPWTQVCVSLRYESFFTSFFFDYFVFFLLSVS